MPTFSVHTLGCRANQADSERLGEILEGAGFEKVPFGQPADCQIVNTCTVTREADRKSQQMIRRALTLGPQVVATGCALNVKGQKLPSAALQLPPGQTDILELLGATECPSTQLVTRPRTRALLKVQDGCDQFCTFCIIPYVRGRSRSFPLAEVVEQARRFEARGFHELVLTGIHLSAWGREFGQDLADLVEALLQATTCRIRLASVEPDLFPQRLLPLLREHPRVCPHLHLVLQHASDPVLTRMHRGYTLAEYDALVRQLAGVTLTTDVMIGFPGETDADFRALLAYVRRTPFYRLHVFPYSPRPGTSAARFADQVPAPVLASRKAQLLALAQRKREAFLRAQVGTVVPVLLEHQDEGWLQGTSDSFLTIQVKGPYRLLKKLCTVRITHRRGDILRGKLEGVSA